MRRISTQSGPLFVWLAAIAMFFLNWNLAPWAFDVSMYVTGARQMLGGARLYVDVVDINPPLILYIHVVNAWVANLLNFPALQFFSLSVAAGAIGSAISLALYLRKNQASPYIAPAFLSASLQALLGLQFGQREHLFMLAFIPYFFVRWSERGKDQRPSHPLLYLSVGLLACLKPSLAAILVAYEACLFWERKKPESKIYLSLAAPGMAYALSFLLWPTESNRAFWQEIVPLVWEHYYTMGKTLPQLLLFWWLPIFSYGLACALYIFLGWKFRKKDHAILFPLGLCALTGLVGAVAQSKGWEYHLLPTQFLLFSGIPHLVQGLHSALPSRLKFFGALALSGTTVLTHSLARLEINLSWPNGIQAYCHHLEIESQTQPGDSLAVFSPNPCYSYPYFAKNNFSPGTRYLFMFPLSFFNNTEERKKLLAIRYPDWNDLTPEEKKFVSHLKTDLKRHPPNLMVFPVSAPQHSFTFMPGYFDAYRYAESTGIFGEIKKNYRLVFQSETLRIFKKLEVSAPRSE